VSLRPAGAGPEKAASAEKTRAATTRIFMAIPREVENPTLPVA